MKSIVLFILIMVNLQAQAEIKCSSIFDGSNNLITKPTTKTQVFKQFDAYDELKKIMTMFKLSPENGVVFNIILETDTTIVDIDKIFEMKHSGIFPQAYIDFLFFLRASLLIRSSSTSQKKRLRTHIPAIQASAHAVLRELEDPNSRGREHQIDNVDRVLKTFVSLFLIYLKNNNALTPTEGIEYYYEGKLQFDLLPNQSQIDGSIFESIIENYFDDIYK